MNWITYNTFDFLLDQYGPASSMILSNSFSKMAKDILSIDDAIDAVSIMDTKGNTLSSASKESHYSTKYQITKDIKNMAGSWAIVILGMTQRMDQSFGSTEAIVSLHKKVQVNTSITS